LYLWPFSWAIAHSFGVPGWLTRPMTHCTCLRGMTKNSSFFVYGRFRELLPTVWGFQADLQGPWHSVYVWEAWQKNHCFCIYGCFNKLLPTVLGFRADLQGPWHLVHFFRSITKNSSFLCFRAIFMSHCPQFWGSGLTYKVHDTRYMFEGRDKKFIIFLFYGRFR
jgi:hypothetical protein